MTPADDLRAPAALADPHPFFRRLRAYDPVHWSEASHAWILTSHTEVSAALRDDVRLSSDRLSPLEARMPEDERHALAGLFELLRGWMVFRDPPDHERLRDPVRKVFTPREVDALAPRIRQIVAELLDALPAGGSCDLVEAFAFPLPALVIAELLGVPPGDREAFKGWALKLGALVFGALEPSERHARAREGAAEFTDYFERLIRHYEARPSDNLISRLIAARDAGGGLATGELAGACTLLLFGGHETTTALIANGMAALCENPDELARLRSDPRLVPSAVEELLRYEGPVKVLVRQVAESHQRGGHALQAGERVYLALAAADRDPAVFTDPDRLDVGRAPNPQLAFGLGRHFCLGANLARAEARIAFESLLARFPTLELAEPVRWGGSIIRRSVEGVRLALGGRPR
jgi:cytochrome P450